MRDRAASSPRIPGAARTQPAEVELGQLMSSGECRSSGALPACAVQRECGGCGLMPLSLEAQRDAKLALVRRALAEHALPAPRIEFTPSPRELGYRNRIRLRILASGEIAFFNPEKSPSCAVLEDGLRGRLDRVLALSRAEPRLFAPFEHLELRSDDAHGRPGLLLGATATARAHQRAELAERLPEFLLGARGDPEIAWQFRRVQGTTLLVPLDAFFQVNTDVNSALVAAVCDGARARGAQRALDLYAGAGNFGLPLAAAGLVVTAVESHAPAVRALRAAASAARLACDGIAARADAALAGLGVGFDLVILDPPRGGAGTVIESVVRLAPRVVALCSCQPESFARDLAALARAGYELEELRALDMFPHTHHIELLAWVTRRW